MKLSSIKEKLETNGYNVTIGKSSILSGVYDGKDDDTGIITLKQIFKISIKEDIIMEYSNGQLPVEKTFKNEKDLISFLKNNFPTTK